MLKREEEVISLDLPWQTICLIACRAFVERLDFEQMLEQVIEYGARNPEPIPKVRIK